MYAAKKIHFVNIFGDSANIFYNYSCTQPANFFFSFLPYVEKQGGRESAGGSEGAVTLYYELKSLHFLTVMCLKIARKSCPICDDS